MNDWYIDRSKNFINDTLNPMLECLASLNGSPIDSTSLCNLIQERGALGNASANPNAALTRFRDHGLLSANNKIGDSALDYYNGKITKAELVVDLLLKRPSKKSNAPSVKPFVLICQFFDNMIEMDTDPDDIFITYAECKEYLFPCDEYTDNNFDLVEKVLAERDYSLGQRLPTPRIALEENEDTNLSIWFNALKETPIFMPQSDDKRVLRPNLKQKEFFRYISINADELEATPTNNNNEQYSYYCNRKKGLLEIIPKVIIPHAIVEDKEDIRVLFEYLFGYKKSAEFDYTKYLKYDCFGVFFPFITMPRLVIRQIESSNAVIGEAFYDFLTKGQDYLIAFNDNRFEYKGHYSNNKKAKYEYKVVKGGAQNIVVYGTPGCGKSYYVQNVILNNLLVSEENRIRTTFFLDYTNTDFVGQVLPKVNEDKSVTYVFTPGPFSIALKKAIEHPDENVALIIEELNRGNAPSIFGDIFQLLDRDKDGRSQYKITNVNIQDYLNKVFSTHFVFDEVKIPANLYIIATMNTSDQNVFTLDTAFKRRWQFEKLKNEFTNKHEYKDYIVPGTNGVTWEKLVNFINENIINHSTTLASEDKQIGVFFVTDEFLVKPGEQATEQQKKKFAYKLLEYLWDDVAKFNRPDWFGADIKTLDQLIEGYLERGIKVFIDEIGE